MHTLRRLLGAAALAAAFLPCLAPRAAAADGELPPGVVARVYGEDLTEEQLLDRLARRYETSEKGRQILEQIVDDLVVAQEAGRRGVSVTDDEAKAYADRMAEIVKVQSGGQKTLRDVLADTKTTYDEFLRTAKEYLVREKMARADLGTKPGDELPEVRMKLWVSSVRRKSGVRYEGLPPGVLARIGDGTAAIDVDRQRFARELRTRLPKELVAGVRAELVVDAATRHAVESAGVTVTEADIDAQLARLRERFEKNPRVQGTGVTFDAFLRQTFGIGEAELRTDPTFRARVGLERMLLRDIDDAKVKKHWEDNRAAFGERALVRQVFVAAGEQGGKFDAKLPTFREASDLALRAKVEILERSGALKGGTTSTNLAEIVTAVAKQFEVDQEKRSQSGEPVAWTRQNVSGETALERAVFEGEIGQLTGPVRSNVGYHVIYVEERRPAPSYDEVKAQVRDELLRVAVRGFQLQLRGDGNVVIPELK